MVYIENDLYLLLASIVFLIAIYIVVLTILFIRNSNELDAYRQLYSIDTKVSELSFEERCNLFDKVNEELEKSREMKQ